MSGFERAFSEFVVRWRWLILLLLPLVVLGLAAGAKNLKFTTNYRVFFSQDNPQLKAFEEMEANYTQDDNVLFILVPRDGDVFSPQVLGAVALLTERAWQIPYSIRVDSLTNFQHTEAEGDELIVRDLVEDAAGLDADTVAQVRSIALAEPMLRDVLVPQDGGVTAVSVTIQLPREDETREIPQVTEFARKLAQEIEGRYPSIDVRLSGMVIMNNAFSEQSQADMQTLVPISFVVMLLLLGLLLRSLIGVVVVALVIVLSVVAGMGAGGFLGYPITPPSAAAPSIILTVAIASSVHLIVSFYHVLEMGSDRATAVLESLRINLQPIFLTSLTTMIGFLTLNFSDVPPFRHLGNMVAVGVGVSFVLVVTFLPALLSLLPVRASRHANPGQRLMERLGATVVAQRQKLLIGTGVVVLLLVAFVPANDLNDMYTRYFDESVEFRRDADFLDRHLGGLYRIDFSLETGASNGINDPEFLRRVDEFAQWLRGQPEVVQVTTLTDTFKRLNKNMHADDPAWYRLPGERELAAQYLLLYEMSLPYGLDLNNRINVDKSSMRLSASMHVLSTKQMLDVERRARTWLDAHLGGVQTAIASPSIMFSHIGERNIRSMLLGTTLALVLISLILVVALRSVKIGLVSMIPNLVPAALGFGVWGIFVGEVGLSLSLVMGMTLGIVVDDTVHFLSKYLRARREDGLDPERAVLFAFARVGMAMAVTTLVLIAGFLVLSLSHFFPNSGMGLLTAIVLGFALLADFLFLPPLLMKMEEMSHA